MSTRTYLAHPPPPEDTCRRFEDPFPQKVSTWFMHDPKLKILYLHPKQVTSALAVVRRKVRQVGRAFSRHGPTQSPLPLSPFSQSPRPKMDVLSFGHPQTSASITFPALFSRLGSARCSTAR